MALIFNHKQGEDGGSTWQGPSKGWNYQSALDILEKNDSKLSSSVPRTDVASIIAAKRKNMKNPVKTEEQDTNKTKREKIHSSGSDSETESNDDESDPLEWIFSLFVLFVSCSSVLTGDRKSVV